MNRRAFVTGLGAVLAAARGGEAQQAGKIYRIGFLGGTSPSQYAVYVEAMRQGLRDLGYVEGRNLAIEYRWAGGKYEQLGPLAAELVRLKVDVIVTHGAPGSQAAKQATTTIPIVMAVVACRRGSPVAQTDGRPATCHEIPAAIARALVRQPTRSERGRRKNFEALQIPPRNSRVVRYPYLHPYSCSLCDLAVILHRRRRRTIWTECRQLFHSRDRTTQKIRSISVSRGRRRSAFHTASC